MQANTELYTAVVDYLKWQKSLGKSTVYRMAIFEVMWYNRGLIKDPNNPKELPSGLLEQAALAAGGVYQTGNKGRSKVIF